MGAAMSEMEGAAGLCGEERMPGDEPLGLHMVSMQRRAKVRSVCCMACSSELPSSRCSRPSVNLSVSAKVSGELINVPTVNNLRASDSRSTVSPSLGMSQVRASVHCLCQPRPPPYLDLHLSWS